MTHEIKGGSWIAEKTPKPGDIVVQIEWPSGMIAVVPAEEYYAHHFIAAPKMMVKWAAVIFWRDLKLWWKWRTKRPPFQTVADALKQTEDL